MSTLSNKQRQEFSLMLPWYANGTLDDEDSRKVEAALAQDNELAREFDLVLEDQAAMIELVSEEEIPISMPERFKAALNATPQSPEPIARPRTSGESAINRILSVLFPAKPRAYAFVAAVFVVLVPAVAIVSYMSGSQQPGLYQTASGTEPATVDTARVLVKFKADVALAEINVLLQDRRGQIVKGPTADGLYELEFEKSDGLVEKLGAETDVLDFALPVN